jgi:hypothetical protein
MSTPVGCPTGSVGGGASTGCTAGLLANIADGTGSAPLVFPGGRALASFSLAGAGWVGGAEDFLGARGIWEKGIARRGVSCAAGRRDKMREKAKRAKYPRRNRNLEAGGKCSAGGHLASHYPRRLCSPVASGKGHYPRRCGPKSPAVT